MTEQWIVAEIAKSDGQFKEITCPYLGCGKCTNYNNRYNCCKSYPQSGKYCARDNCEILGSNIPNNTEESNTICSECKNNCCTHILVPINSEITEEFLEKWMNIDCTACSKIFGT